MKYLHKKNYPQWECKIKMQFGMPTLIENNTIEENIALCKKLKLKFIELNMNFPEYQIEQLDNWEFFYKLAEKNQIYYTIHLDENLNIADFNSLVRNACLETVQRVIEVAKHFVSLKDKFGDRPQPLIINMHLNHGIFITLPDKKVWMYDRNFQVYEKYFLDFKNLCEKWIGDTDIKIAVENTNGFCNFETKILKMLLESTKFCLTWDIGHSKATKEIDIPFIKSYKAKISHFHIHDGTENPPKNHLALGDGKIDLIERLELAQKTNSRCVLETKTIQALEKSVQWLGENFSEKMN